MTASGLPTVRADYAYTKRGQTETVTRYADAAGTTKVGQSTYTYDDSARLTQLTHANGSGVTLANYGYGYDAASRLTSETINGVTRTYGYDKVGQLTNDNGTLYTYDATGNRTNAGYVTGPGNRLQSDGIWTYTYDDAGQMVKKSKGASAETWTYSYDHRGQLTLADQRATDGGVLQARIEYGIDGFGNRVQRLQRDGSLAVVADERYALDGWDPAKPGALGTEGFDAWADVDGSGTVTTRRMFGAGFDDPAARLTAAGAVAWYGADHLGSVRQLFDNSGAVIGSRDYAAFGAVTTATGSGLDRYAFTGRELDATTGQLFVRARVLDGGRWTTEDPIRSDQANQYRYVGNAPTGFTDPSGYQGTAQGSLGGSGSMELLPDVSGGGSVELLPGDGEAPPWDPLLWRGPDVSGVIRGTWEGRYHRGNRSRLGVHCFQGNF